MGQGVEKLKDMKMDMIDARLGEDPATRFLS